MTAKIRTNERVERIIEGENENAYLSKWVFPVSDDFSIYNRFWGEPLFSKYHSLYHLLHRGVVGSTEIFCRTDRHGYEAQVSSLSRAVDEV